MFDIENTLSFNTDSLVSGNDYDYVTRTSQNQGILQQTGFINKDNINDAGNWSLGLLQMDFFYRRKPWYAGQFVRKIIPKIYIPEATVSFFTAILNQQKSRLLSVLVRNVDKVFKSLNVKIPITKDGGIDFDFMERFISELEAEHVAELEAYLLATGLKDCTITNEEREVLDGFGKLEWANFNIKDLFGKATRGKRLKSADRIKGSLPFVTAGESYEGISDYIANDVEIFSNNTTTIDMFGSAKYRNYKYGGDDHIAVVHTEKLPKFAAIFITAAIHKASYTGKFSYARNFYAKDADELDILLPTKNNKPDYELM